MSAQRKKAIEKQVEKLRTEKSQLKKDIRIKKARLEKVYARINKYFDEYYKLQVLSKRKPGKNKRKRRKNRKWWLPREQVTVTSLIAKGHEAKCACCNALENLTFDHIMPKARGGSDTTKNGQILCKRCNEFKADRRITLEVLRIEIAEAEKLIEQAN